MNKNKLSVLVSVVIGIVFMVSGCASLDKAGSLHRRGQDEEALKMAQEFLDEDEEESVRLSAVSLIGRIGGKKAGAMLMPLLDDPSPVIKSAAVKNIGLMKYASASEKLIEIALDAKADLFETTAGAIRHIGPPAIDLLVKRFSSSNDAARNDRYKKLILQVGPSAAAGIARNLVGKSYFENRTNFEILIAFKNPKVAYWMLKEIDNPEVADMVVEGLVKLGRMAVVPVMSRLEKLKGESGNVDTKERLITVLGELKDSRAAGLLEELTQNDSDRVRNASDFALKKIRGF
ncbi:MAG: HEAT repeat domain-containing protein [Proteobacteria bacterium]|nr:HEAT repeat domain-containing protein [Pseudomonadota bacterium]